MALELVLAKEKKVIPAKTNKPQTEFWVEDGVLYTKTPGFDLDKAWVSKQSGKSVNFIHSQAKGPISVDGEDIYPFGQDATCVVSMRTPVPKQD